MQPVRTFDNRSMLYKKLHKVDTLDYQKHANPYTAETAEDFINATGPSLAPVDRSMS